MPDDGYEYLLGLKDELSAPARQASAALESMSRAMLRVDQNTRALAEGMTRAVRGVGDAEAAMHSAHGGAHSMASGISFAVRGFDDLSRGGKYAANGLLDVGKSLARLGPALIGVGLLGGAAALAHFGFEASETKRDLTEMFDVVQGEGKGARTFDQVNQIAEGVHAPIEKVADVTRGLLELGLTNQTQLLQTVRAVEDLQRVGLESGARKLEGIVEKSLAAGHLALGRGGAGAARALSGTGITESDLAKELGLTTKQLEAELKTGKVTVEEGLQAIDNAILRGKVGELATKRFTLSDAFQDLHNSVRQLFQDSDASPLTSAIRQVTEDFADATQGSTFLRDSLDTIFSGIADGIKLASGLGESFVEAAQMAHAAWDAVGDAISTIGHSEAESKQILAQRRTQRHAEELGDAIAQQSEAFDKIKELAQTGASPSEIKRRAHRMGIDVDVLAPGKAAPHTREPEGIRREQAGINVGTVDIGPKGEVGAEHPEHWKVRVPPGAIQGAHELGAQTYDGIEEGYREAAVLYSPSRRMFEMGQDTFEGLENGYERSRRETPDLGGMGGKAVTVNVHPGAFHVEAHGADAQELVMLLESQIADVFERVALEMGA